MAIPSYTRFWLQLVPLIPSLIVTFIILYYFLKKRALRTALHNHVNILLLSVGLIEELTGVVWEMYFYRNGVTPVLTTVFCCSWTFMASITIVSNYILMTWASIERHILIFHSDWFATRIKRLLFHYIPLMMCILYPVTFYFVMLFIVPCDIPLKLTAEECGRYSCITRNPRISLYDSIAHCILPAFAIVIFSAALFVRVLCQKYRAHQRINWRNYKKMAYQLFPISFLYTVLVLPPMIMYAAYSGGLPRTVARDYYSDAIFFVQWVIFFTPFACAISLPELSTKCRNAILFWQRRHTVGPVQLLTASRPDARR
ncbi:unnamed protein product [Adineta ricciae]|uniref:G-protein coupled receptors family 1 profile domain-containing protein n=1 Tax=Adineta ricciae TaxID=249248 RepID=A0A816HER0_ADIRI|nr:unnamed protein product [Adineta ricciae]